MTARRGSLPIDAWGIDGSSADTEAVSDRRLPMGAPMVVESTKGDVVSARRIRVKVVSLAVGALLVSSVAVSAQDAAPSGPPTAVGTGGAAATVETVATEAAIDVLRRGRQRGRRGRCSGRRVGGDRAVLGWHRRRRVHGYLPGRRSARDDDRSPRDGADGDAPRVVLRERRPAAVQRRPVQRALRWRARHGATAGTRRSSGTARCRWPRCCSRRSGWRRTGS